MAEEVSRSMRTRRGLRRNLGDSTSKLLRLKSGLEIHSHGLLSKLPMDTGLRLALLRERSHSEPKFESGRFLLCSAKPGQESFQRQALFSPSEYPSMEKWAVGLEMESKISYRDSNHSSNQRVFLMKLSIIIPTRARGSYLKSSIQSAIVAANNTDWPVEIIVSDNVSEDNTKNIVKSFLDKRIVYIKTQRRLSMRGNFEFALSHSSGSHLLFIGDDDAVLPHGLQLLKKIIEETDTDAVKWPSINYIWPNPDTGSPGNVKLRTHHLSAVRATVDSRKLLKQFSNGKIRSYMEGVMIYHGCVSRRLIDRVCNIQNGPYFWCAAPDVYAAILNIFVVKTPIQKISIPITIGGESPKSNGASTLRYGQGINEGDKKVFELFKKEYRDDQYLGALGPDNPSITMHMLDSLQTASNVLNIPIDVSSTRWAKIILKELRNFSPEIQRRCKEQAKNLLKIDLPACGHGFKREVTINSTNRNQPAVSELGKLRIRNEFLKIKISGGREMEKSETAARFIDELLSMHDYSTALRNSWKPVIWRMVDIHKKAREYSLRAGFWE